MSSIDWIIVDRDFGSVTFQPLNRADDGEYICRAENDLGYAESTGFLNVIGTYDDAIKCHLLGMIWGMEFTPQPGPPSQCKGCLSQVWDSHVIDKTVARPSCLVHPGVRGKRRVSEIDLSQPRRETAFWWCHNGPVTSRLTDRIKWPNYPVELIGIYVHINTYNK